MKNNKGIILSTYIYILLVFFIVLLTTMLMVLNNTKLLATKIKENASDITKSGYNDFNIVLIGPINKGHNKGTSYVDDGYIAESKTGKSIVATVESTVNTSVAGTYTYKYTVIYGGISKSVTRTVNVFDIETNFSYTGAAQTFVPGVSGYYKVELWGAQNAALGGYTSGIIYLDPTQTLYVYVGEKSTVAGATSFNGGTGTGGGAPGGGATDIRLVSGAWNDLTSLRSRIMVAGGGGAGQSLGSGGGMVGLKGGTATGGTQTEGGTQESTYGNGSFGIGGGGCGGGGGYYGGGGGTCANGGGGGSSFISGYAGVYSTIGNTQHSSGMYFTDATIQTGVNTGNGSAKITYIGTVAPTKVNTNLNNVRYIKDCINGSNSSTNNHWAEIQGIVGGINVALNKNVTGTSAVNTTTNSGTYTTITNGIISASTSDLAQSASTGLQCVTVDLEKSYNLDEVAVWHYWLDGRVYKSNTVYVSSNNSDWTVAIATDEIETSQGKRANVWRQLRIPNLVANGSFISSTVNGWSTASASVTNSVTGTIGSTGLYINDTSTATGYWNYYPKYLITGHINYLSSDIKVDSVTAEKVSFSIRDSGGTSSQSNPIYTPNADYVRTSLWFTATSADEQIQLGTSVAATAKAYYKNVMAIDLTNAFGSGNEPSQAWCDANLNYYDGAINTNISP